MQCIDFFQNDKVGYNDQVLPRKWLFIQVIIFRLAILDCSVVQDHDKNAILWWPMAWGTRWGWSSMVWPYFSLAETRQSPNFCYV